MTEMSLEAFILSIENVHYPISPQCSLFIPPVSILGLLSNVFWEKRKETLACYGSLPKFYVQAPSNKNLKCMSINMLYFFKL